MLVFFLILLGVLSRFLPHPENFTAVGAVALFSGVYLNKRQSLLLVLSMLIISDLLIGLYDPIVILFNWTGFILIALLGRNLKKNKGLFRILGYSLFSSFLYYLVSNFGVWFAGWYPRNIQGLILCYIMAIPFLRNFTLSTILYSAIFFGVYELTNFLVKDKKLKEVLLKNI